MHADRNERRIRGVIAFFESKASRAAGAINYESYSDDPEGFIRDVLRDDLLWEKPLEMIESVRTNRKTTVRGANSVGKDHTISELAFWWMFAKRGLVLITGPTQKQVFEIIFGRELRTLANRAGLPVDVQRFAARPEDDTSVRRSPGQSYEPAEFKCGILGMVSTDTAKLTGHHAPHVMCIITEAQGVDDVAFNAMYSNATGPEDRIVVVGNPYIDIGEFYQTHRADSSWYPIQITAHEHPNIVERRIVIPGGPSIEWLEDMRKVHGESSSWWQCFVEANFPQTSIDVLFPAKDLDPAIRPSVEKQAELAIQQAGRSYIVAFDVAKGGGDAAGWAVLQGPRYLGAGRFETAGIIETEERCVKLLLELRIAPQSPAPTHAALGITWHDGVVIRNGERMRPGTVIIDSAPTGGGPGIIAHLEHDYGYEVIAFNGAARVQPTGDEQERYENMRAFGYWSLHLACQNRAVWLPDSALLREELSATTYKFNNRDGVQVSRKPDIRKILKRSPDEADAVMMAWTVERSGASLGAAEANVDYGF